MATFVSNRDSGGRTDEEGHLRFLAASFTGNVLSGQQVTENSPNAMTVLVSEGQIRIPYSDYAYMAWSEGNTIVSVATADPSNPRIDRVVAYIDRSMSFVDTDINNPGMLKYKAVTGTPNAVPSAPNDAAVNSSVSNNPWVELARISVTAALSSVTNAKITDTRSFVQLSTNVQAAHLMPIGTMLDYAGTTAPSGFLLCYGQTISRTTYKDLFGIIGTIYGSGDGSTTFTLPDCRGRVAAGKDNMGGTSADRLTLQDATNGINGDGLGNVGGKESHTQTITEMPLHGHDFRYAVQGSGGGVNNIYSMPYAASANGSIVTSGSPPATSGELRAGVIPNGGDGAHNNVQPTIIFNKIIKI